MKITPKDFTKLLRIFAMMLTLFFSVSCSSKPGDALVGKWSEIDGTEKIECFKDGTITAIDKGMNVGGKYTFIDKDRMKVEFGGIGSLAGPLVVTVSMSGDEMTWTAQDGKVTKYKREK